MKAELEKRPTVKGILDRVKAEKGLQAYINEMYEWKGAVWSIFLTVRRSFPNQDIQVLITLNNKFQSEPLDLFL